MKKFTKLFAVLSSAVMLFSLLGITPVTAAETTEKLYTLSELMEMSDEEFMTFDGTMNFYNKLSSQMEKYGFITGVLWVDLSMEDEGIKYTTNKTEMKIEELLENTVEFEIESPISLDENYLEENLLFYGDVFSVKFSDYDPYSETYEITDESLIEFTKCWYCVNQVIEIDYYGPDNTLLSENDESIISGDVTLDKSVDLYDVIWIASDLTGIFKLTESQQKVGDVNEDGVCDLYDAIAIAETIMEKTI